MNYKMSLKINPQYVLSRTVALTLHPSFVSKHTHVRSDNVLIHTFTSTGIVFSIIHDGEMTVFCCALLISMPPINGQIQIEIRSSETQMKYFTKNLSRRLPHFTNTVILDNQCMFNDDIQADLLRGKGGVDDSPFSSTTEHDSDETRFSDKILKIRNEDSDEDSDEEDSDEEKEDPILAVVLEDGNRIYVFEKLDDNDFFCILFLKGVVYLLQVDRYDLSTLKSSNSEKLIAMFERDSVDFSERLEGFGEVDLSCRIVIADPIQITCDFDNSFGRIVLTKQLIIENNELREI